MRVLPVEVITASSPHQPLIYSNVSAVSLFR